MLGTLLAPVTGGASLAIGALVSSALGVENTPEAVEAELKRNPEALLKIKELEQKENESLRKQVLDLAKLDQEKYIKAHDTYQTKHEMADTIAKRIIERNLPYIAVLVTANLALIHYMKTEVALLAIASNIIGITIGNLFAERQAIVNFFFGSSLGSKQKQKQLDKDS
jgi:hypothetical protein